MAANDRVLFVGGNWKCNEVNKELRNCAETLAQMKLADTGVQVVVAPTPCYLSTFNDIFAATKNGAMVASQNVSAQGYGAYTGEISPGHLNDLGISWTIIGHSERRKYYGETNEIVQKKVTNALTNGLNVIACFGETLEQRDAGNTDSVNKEQLQAIIDGIKAADNQMDKCVLAYEPVWAIGTGKTCPSEEAERVCKMLRKYLAEQLPQGGADMRIIYGGSVKKANSDELIQQPNVDGFLVGGASLTAEKFVPVIESAINYRKGHRISKL